jgi:hypothetical protein
MSSGECGTGISRLRQMRETVASDRATELPRPPRCAFQCWRQGPMSRRAMRFRRRAQHKLLQMRAVRFQEAIHRCGPLGSAGVQQSGRSAVTDRQERSWFSTAALFRSSETRRARRVRGPRGRPQDRSTSPDRGLLLRKHFTSQTAMQVGKQLRPYRATDPASSTVGDSGRSADTENQPAVLLIVIETQPPRIEGLPFYFAKASEALPQTDEAHFRHA